MMARAKRKGVDLMPIIDVELGTLDGLAASAQATIYSSVIENVNSGEDYGSGSIKGLQLAVTIKPEAVVEMPPRITVLITPSGMTVPTVVTAAAVKQNERFMWGQFQVFPYADPTAATVWFGSLRLKTARRFHSGDVLTILCTNDDPATAFGAAAVGMVFGRAYVTED